MNGANRCFLIIDTILVLFEQNTLSLTDLHLGFEDGSRLLNQHSNNFKIVNSHKGRTVSLKCFIWTIHFNFFGKYDTYKSVIFINEMKTKIFVSEKF